MAQSLTTTLQWRRACFFVIVGLFFMLQSGQAFGQVIFGDPTSTVGGSNRFNLSVGGGGVINQKFKFDAAPLTYVTPTRTLVFEGEETSVKFEGEHVFLTGAYRLGAAGEIFLTIGQTQLRDKDEIFDGGLGLFWGGGVRISPPQPGPFKVGLVLQGFSGRTKDESFDVLIDAFRVTEDGTESVFSEGRGEDEIKYMGLSALIGVSVQYFTSFRPYAGLMLTYLKGNEKGSISGTGFVNDCVISTPCVATTEPFTASWDMDFEADSMIGGVLGFQFNPDGPFTVIIEGQVGTQSAYFVSAGMQF